MGYDDIDALVIAISDTSRHASHTPCNTSPLHRMHAYIIPNAFDRWIRSMTPQPLNIASVVNTTINAVTTIMAAAGLDVTVMDNTFDAEIRDQGQYKILLVAPEMSTSDELQVIAKCIMYRIDALCNEIVAAILIGQVFTEEHALPAFLLLSKTSIDGARLN